MRKLFLILVMSVAFSGVAVAAVNINTATKEELTSIKGVGEKRAQDIIDYRTKNGPFKTVDDLEKVPGVGPGLMKRVRSQVSTSGKTVIDKPAQKTIKTTKSTTKAAEPAKSDGLKSDKASGKSAEKLTTGTKVEEKKTK
jgi:competence protein ComEA